MRQASCSQEVSILKAIRTGTWEEAVSTHLAGCAACEEIVQASRWMQALAQDCENAETLPDAGRVWWRAQVSEEQAKAERAQELLEWVELISATIFSAGLAGWIVWHWNAIQSSLTSFIADTWLHSWIATSSVLNMALLTVSSGAVILSIVTLAIAYPMLARD